MPNPAFYPIKNGLNIYISDSVCQWLERALYIRYTWNKVKHPWKIIVFIFLSSSGIYIPDKVLSSHAVRLSHFSTSPAKLGRIAGSIRPKF